MNTLTKVLMTLALIVVGYYLFIGLFYVVAAGVLLILALYGFSFVQKYWRRIFGGGEEPSANSFTIDVERRFSDGTVVTHSRRSYGSAGSAKEPSNIKVIDIT